MLTDEPKYDQEGYYNNIEDVINAYKELDDKYRASKDDEPLFKTPTECNYLKFVREKASKDWDPSIYCPHHDLVSDETKSSLGEIVD